MDNVTSRFISGDIITVESAGIKIDPSTEKYINPASAHSPNMPEIVHMFSQFETALDQEGVGILEGVVQLPINFAGSTTSGKPWTPVFYQHGQYQIGDLSSIFSGVLAGSHSPFVGYLLEEITTEDDYARVYCPMGIRSVKTDMQSDNGVTVNNGIPYFDFMADTLDRTVRYTGMIPLGSRFFGIRNPSDYTKWYLPFFFQYTSTVTGNAFCTITLEVHDSAAAAIKTTTFTNINVTVSAIGQKHWWCNLLDIGSESIREGSHFNIIINRKGNNASDTLNGGTLLIQRPFILL